MIQVLSQKVIRILIVMQQHFQCHSLHTPKEAVEFFHRSKRLLAVALKNETIGWGT